MANSKAGTALLLLEAGQSKWKALLEVLKKEE
jgi:hypothetical protein